MLIADRPFCPYKLSDEQMESITEQIKQQEILPPHRIFTDKKELDVWVEDILIFWEQIYLDRHSHSWRIPWIYHTVVEQNLPDHQIITHRFFSKTGWVARFDEELALVNATEEIYA
ncbi:MAG: hypothetical protein AB4058_01950 [Microcystaceae cyanobacterium]